MERRKLRWSYLGEVRYAPASRLQKQLSDRLAAGDGSEHLLFLQHPHVYTLGRSAAARDVLADERWLTRNGVEVVETNRGGQVTYHGPGQLVGYPIIDLKPDRRDVRRYVHDLQRVLVRTLADFGIESRGAGEQARIGVWAGPQKIASIGVHLSRWITTHGFALNVTTDLAFFSGIVPCGLGGVQMASMESLSGRGHSVEEVAACVVEHFGEVFDRELQPVAASDVWQGAKAGPLEVSDRA